MAVPLSDLLKKGQLNKVVWEEAQDLAHCSLKNAIINQPILRLPNHDKEFALRTDACDMGISAELLQEMNVDYFL